MPFEVLAAAGVALVVTGSGPWNPSGAASTASVVAGNGGWGPIERIASGDYFGSPELSADAAGDAVVAWEAGTGSVWAAVRDGGSGGWSPPRLLSARRGDPVDYAVAGDGNGAAIVVTAGRTLVVRKLELVNQAWGKPQTLPIRASVPQGLVAALDSGGNATIIYSQGSRRLDRWVAIEGSIRTNRWGKPRTLLMRARADEWHQLQLAVDPAGAAVVTWTGCAERRCATGRAMAEPALRSYRISGLVRARPGGPWRPLGVSERVRLYNLIGTDRQQAMVADRTGAITVLWTAAASNPSAVRSIRRGTGEPWKYETVAQLAQGFITGVDLNINPGDGLHLATGSSGDIFAWWDVWDARSNEHQVLGAERRAADGYWRTLTFPPGLASSDYVYLTEAGNGTVIAVGTDAAAVRAPQSTSWLVTALGALTSSRSRPVAISATASGAVAVLSPRFNQGLLEAAAYR
jgi:hypothetical protein